MVTTTSPGAVSATTGPGSASGRRLRDARPAEVRAAWLFSTPFLALFMLFIAVPVAATMMISFTDFTSRDMATPFAVDFVGLANYIAIFQDEAVQHGMRNTAYFVLVGVPLTMAAGLAVAMLLDKDITRMRAFFRLGFYLPVVTSIVAVAVVWKVLLQTGSGLINTALGWVGINGPAWLGDPNWSMPGLILMAIWRNFGSSMIVFLAGLQAIPSSLYEAADVDGATTWSRFRYITLPLLRPTILFVSVTTMIGYLQFFDEPFVMTQGGPVQSTTSIAMETYGMFGYGDFGQAAALSYVTFVIIMVVTAIQFRVLRSTP